MIFWNCVNVYECNLDKLWWQNECSPLTDYDKLVKVSGENQKRRKGDGFQPTRIIFSTQTTESTRGWRAIYNLHVGILRGMHRLMIEWDQIKTVSACVSTGIPWSIRSRSKRVLIYWTLSYTPDHLLVPWGCSLFSITFSFSSWGQVKSRRIPLVW